MFDPDEIRRDFPILNRVIDGNKIIYFDNAATSQKPIQVIDAISNYYKYYNSNIHRSAHRLAREATKLYEDAHWITAKFIGANSGDEIIFVRNTTEALNLIAYSWGLKYLNEDDEIVVTIMDHHSNIVPWRIISKIKGCKLKFVKLDENGYLDYNDLESKISDKTRVISVPHVSNVLGTIVDLNRIRKYAREVDALFIVDGAQSVPHMPVDVKKLDIDLLAFSGHKMLGPTGIGVLYGKKEILEDMDPFLGGGDMINSVECDVKSLGCRIIYAELPRKFEAGTPNIAGAVGLSEAIKYLEKLGMENVRRHEEELIKYTLERLDEISTLRYYGPSDHKFRGGLVSFNMEGFDSHELAILLDEYNIMVRSGFHCAQPLHLYLGISSSVRASFYIYNTEEEVDRFIEVLKGFEEMV